MKKKYVTLLRGINVGGKNRLKMSDLIILLERSNAQSVKTYIQSGNVVFVHQANLNSIAFSNAIKKAIQEAYQYDIELITLNLTSFMEVCHVNILAQQYPDRLKWLHVSIFSESININEEQKDKLQALKKESEEVYYTNKALYLYCPNGYGKTKLHNKAIEKLLNTKATTRNWRTITKLKEMLNNAGRV